MEPVPGTNRPFSAQFHSKIAILSRLSLGRGGVRPWDDCPTRAVRKMFMCFLFIGFLLPKLRIPPELPQKRVNFRGLLKAGRTLSLLSLLYAKTARNLRKKQRFPPLPNPLNPWKRREDAPKKQGTKKKSKDIPKARIGGSGKLRGSFYGG